MTTSKRVALTTATIKSTSGAQYTLDDVRWEVAEEIREKMADGHTFGQVECGGQTYRWRAD